MRRGLPGAPCTQPVRNPGRYYLSRADEAQTVGVNSRLFGDQLRQHRSAAGLTQEELAERAGLSRRGIADLERGARRSPHPDTVRRLGHALALDTTELAAMHAAVQPLTPGASAALGLTRLPMPLGSFVDRELELAEARRLLRTSRLLTLIGTGGVGKTRLAIEVARELTATHRDGVWFVDLAPLADPALVATTVLVALRLHEIPRRSVIERLQQHLRTRHLLLVLDNCEHLIASCAELVSAILDAAPHVQVLATSREPLGVSGERTYRVPSLAAPDPGTLPSLEQLATYPAVELFVERAQLVRPDFGLTPLNAADVAQVCDGLDGIPLALELAAARLRALSLEQVVTRLDDRLRLLVGGNRTVSARQRTLVATLDWSFHLLTEAERVLLRRLAVFAGGWTLAAAETVGSEVGVVREDVLDLLIGLIDKSFVLADVHGAEARYRLLETIRQYCAKRLSECGELAQVRQTHATYYLTWLATADPRSASAHAPSWVHRLDIEYDNLRAAMRWALDRGELALVLPAGLALTRYGIWRGYLRELQQWWEEALEVSAGGDPAWWPTVATLLAIVLFLQGEDQRMFPLLDASLARFRSLGHKRGIAHTLLQLGSAAPLRGDPRAGIPLLREAEVQFRELGQHEDVAWTLWCLGNTAQLQGDHGEAEALYTRALAAVRDVRYPSTIAQAIALEGLEGNMLTSLGSVALLQGDLERAEGCLREGGLLCAQVESAHLLAACVLHLAGVALCRGDARRGARLLGAAEGLWGATDSAILPVHREMHERVFTDLRRGLSERTFASIRAEGRQMSLQDVTAYALSAQQVAANYDESPLKALTRREREVVNLAAHGLTNREVAQSLGLAEGTARVHVEHILAKLDLHSRAQLAAWAAAHGVLGTSG